MEKWTVSGKPRMALFAGDQGIMTGHELTYDYNFDPFSQKNVQECRCGAPSCRGVLGPRAKEEKKPKADQNTSASTKRKVVQLVEESTLSTNKKRNSGIKEGSPRKILAKKGIVRSSPAAKKAGISRRPSVLKRFVKGAKERTLPKRVVSSSSAAEKLIAKEQPLGRTLSRRESVRAKAETVKRNVVRTVRGARPGRERSIRAIADEDEDD